MAILNISKRSMMPEWHQLDSSITMPQQQESTKKNFKIKFQVVLVFNRTKRRDSNQSPQLPRQARKLKFHLW